MPCYQTQTCNVNLGEQTDQEILETALREQGYSTVRQNQVITFNKADQQIRGTFQNGRLSVSSPRGIKVDTDAIKRAYTAETLKAKAKKQGWKLTKKPGNVWKAQKIANRM